MTDNRESFSQEIEQLSQAIRSVDHRLRGEAAPDPVALNELRLALDNLRLTAWTVSELMTARNAKNNPANLLAFLAGERLRRFEQLARNLCTDFDRRVLTGESNGMTSLVDAITALQQRLAQCVRKQEHRFEKAAG